MGKVLVSASHFDTLCKEAWKLLEENGHEVIFDPARSFPAYSYEELVNIIPDIDAAFIGMDIYDEKVFKIAPKLKCVCKFGVGVDYQFGGCVQIWGQGLQLSRTKLQCRGRIDDWLYHRYPARSASAPQSDGKE